MSLGYEKHLTGKAQLFMAKHILLVTQYFAPEQFRVNDICSEWVRRGYKVTVLTGKPNYPQGKYYSGYGFFKKRREKIYGAEVIRLPLIPRGKTPLMLALNYVSFVLSGLFWKIFTRLQADEVFIYQTSPIMQAYPGIWFAKKRKIPCNLYVLDLWPESFSDITGIRCKWVLKSLEYMVRSVYRRCDRIFMSSEGFADSIISHGGDKGKLVYWPQYAEEFYRPVPPEQADVSDLPDDSRFKVLFAGNIGQAQGLSVLPKTATLLRQNSYRILFCLIGDGSYRETLQQQVQKNGLDADFVFLGRRPAEEIPKYMAKCDASLVSLSKSDIFAQTLPAKVQSSMACGKPIVACADGETQRVVCEAQAGVGADAEDAEQLAQQLMRLIAAPEEERRKTGENARRYFEQHFAKEKLMYEMDSYLA